uniref:Uncharacterized protein n=1 Tax=Oryza meridionalis TaxID=40149 RepID=A0A0E0DR44_9ORYZ
MDRQTAELQGQYNAATATRGGGSPGGGDGDVRRRRRRGLATATTQLLDTSYSEFSPPTLLDDDHPHSKV